MNAWGFLERDLWDPEIPTTIWALYVYIKYIH